MQKTINKSFNLCGITLHSGKHSNISVNPAPADTGIVFKRNDLKVSHGDTIIKANYQNVIKSDLCTKIANKNNISVSTIEHIMSAFHGMKIDNAIVELDTDEMPILDGSAVEYVRGIESVGVKYLSSKKKIIRILRPIIFRNNESYIKVQPSEEFQIDYTINYDHQSIKTQQFSFNFDQEIDYKKIISNCRTFGFKHEVDYLREKGLIAGGSFDNAIVLDDHGIMNKNPLRQEKEFVKHKILDFIGDIFLLGSSIKGSFEIYKGGHRLTHDLMKSIMSDDSNWIFEDHTPYNLKLENIDYIEEVSVAI